MILTVLIGNTNTRLCWFENHRIYRRKVLPTARLTLARRPKAGLVSKVFGSFKNIQGAAVASVVPQLTYPIYLTLRRQVPTLLLTAKTPTPLRFRYDRRLVGADRVCVAVGGYFRFQDNLIIIDFGTAITLNIVQKEGIFLGGPILPGAEMIFSALAEKTARLPRVTFAFRANPLTLTTHTAIQAGVGNLIIGGLNRIVSEITRRRKRDYLIVATGGAAFQFKRHLKWIKTVDQDLANRGLAEIFYFTGSQRQSADSNPSARHAEPLGSVIARAPRLRHSDRANGEWRNPFARGRLRPEQAPLLMGLGQVSVRSGRD
ncbi:MAG: type III pantothenate kinase [candidate division WOR-3 bacterium]